jgi:hypothetical protein
MMVLRWAAAVVPMNKQKFRTVIVYRHLGTLEAALERKGAVLEAKVA